MKHVLVISFALMYLLLTAGFTINIHYCLGEIESVTLIPSAKSCCCESAEMPMNCCGDEQMIFQFSPKDQLIVSESLEFKPLIIEIIELSPLQLIEFESHQKTILKYCKSPPPDNIPIWLKHSHFTFYG